MDLEFTDEQQFLRESIRGTVEREAPLAQVREWVLDRDEPDHDPALQIAVRQGWTGIGIDERHGGQGGDVPELAILAEELGRGAVPADALYATLLATGALTRSTAAGDAAPLIEALAAGEQRAAILHGGDGTADVELADSEPTARLVLGAGDGAQLLAYTGASLALYERPAELRPRRHVDRTRLLADVTVTGEPTAIYELDAPDAMTDIAARAAV